MLGTTTTAVNSGLRRARAQLAQALPDEDDVAEPGEPGRRAMLDRFAAAFENGDMTALTELLRQDVALEMPPMLTWFACRGTVRRFLATKLLGVPGQFRLLAVLADGQPAFRGLRTRGLTACTAPTPGRLAPTVTATGIARIVIFLSPGLLGLFGLPPEHDPGAENPPPSAAAVADRAACRRPADGEPRGPRIRGQLRALQYPAGEARAPAVLPHAVCLVGPGMAAAPRERLAGGAARGPHHRVRLRPRRRGTTAPGPTPPATCAAGPPACWPPAPRTVTPTIWSPSVTASSPPGWSPPPGPSRSRSMAGTSRSRAAAPAGPAGPGGDLAADRPVVHHAGGPGGTVRGPVPVPGPAGPGDQLVAFLGRHPRIPAAPGPPDPGPDRPRSA